MYYHVRITQKSNRSHDETKLDFSEEQIRERIIEPYEQSEPIIINGKTIPSEDIERIRISRSSNDSRQLIARAKAEEAASPIAIIGGPSFEWQAADLADDVTDQMILGPPGWRVPKTKSKLKAEPRANTSGIVRKSKTRKNTSRTEALENRVRSRQKVFVVHGHDHALKSDVEIFLGEIGLEPIVLHREADQGQTVIEKFEHYSDVDYVIVLLTPDDVGCSAIEFANADKTLEYRARQNVVFELGFFAGRLGRHKVCCIYKAGVVLPSDLSGFVYKEIRVSVEEVGYSLIKEFKAAGLEIQVRS